MKKTLIYSIFIAGLLLSACQETNPRETSFSTDSYNQEIDAAWKYIKQNDWDDRVDGGKENATVDQVLVDETYELLNDEYISKEVFKVSFKEKENSAVGAPSILVSHDGEIVGYMVGE